MRHVFVLSLVVVLIGTTAAAAAETEEQAIQHQLRTLAQYPKLVRQAILEVLNLPEVLTKLDGKGPAAGNPAVQDSARLLAKYPDVVKLLIDRPEVLVLGAKAYADNKSKTIAILDQIETDNATAVEEWSKRLAPDAEAVAQLKQAAVAYAKLPGTSVHDTGFTTAGEVIKIHGHPSPAFIDHVMTHADRYSAAAHVMASQWLSSKNTAAYDRTFHHWWARHEHNFHHTLLRNDEHRADRLAELAKFHGKYGHVKAEERHAKFHEHIKDYPHLGNLKKHDPKKHTARAGMHEKPNHKDGHAAGKDPRHAGAGKVQHEVRREAGSHDHHMHHAMAGHQHHAQHHAPHQKGKKA
jgi:hypothetical protein